MFAVRRRNYTPALSAGAATAGDQLGSGPDWASSATPHLTTLWEPFPCRWQSLLLRCRGARHRAAWESCSGGAGGVVTHQVHDEVQLDGEVHDEEDAGPGVPGVRGHHHIWETAFAEHVTHRARGCQPPASLRTSLFSAFPASSRLPLLSPHGLRAHQAAPIPHREMEYSGPRRREGPGH